MAARDFNLPPYSPEKPRLVPSRPPRRWKRITAWILGIVALLIIVAGIGIAVLLHSPSFHNYILRTAQQKAADALNTRVQLQNFAIHPATLSLDLYGLTVDGSGPGANQPLLQVDHIGLGVRVISVLHRQWNLDNVAVDHPVMNLIVDQAGQSNLPTPKTSNNSSTNIFDLAIRHIVLDRGEVYYNDRKNTLAADLRDLTFQSSYDNVDNGRYFGSVSYRDGHLQYGAYAPLEHDFQAQFDVRRSRTQLSNVVLQSGSSQIKLDASLENYSNPTVHATYAISLDGAQLRTLLKNASLPAGMIFSEGTASYVSSAGKPLLDTTTVQGTIRSSLLQVRTPSLRTDIRNLAASYDLANGNAEVKDVHARILGGELTGTATVRDLSGRSEGHVSANLRGVSLADLKTLANSASLRTVVVSGRGNADATANWAGNMHDLVAHLDATANASVAPARQNTAANTIPVNAVVHARYANARQEIELDQSYVHTQQTSINLNGTVSQRSALQVQIQSNDLHELETVADVFNRPAAGKSAAQPLGLYGTASFNGTVRGSLNSPQIAGQLNANNVKLRGSAFRLLRTSVQASPSLISLQNGVLELGGQGRAMFSVQSALHDWSYTPSSPFTVKLNASQLSVAELSRVANASLPVSGTLNANVTAHGTQLNPIGQGDINLHNATISGEPIQLADVRFQGTGNSVHVNLRVQSAAGSAQGEVTYAPRQQGYDAQLRATNIHLERIKTLRDRNLQLSGIMNLSASGRGTLQNPQGQASLTIPQLSVQQQQIKNINFQGNVANHEANFTLKSAVSNTPLQAQGKVALTGDYYADAKLDTPVIPLQPLLATYAPAQAANISGQTEIHASLRGPLKNKALLEAHLNVPTLAVNYRSTSPASGVPVNVQIGAVTPIRVDYANGVLDLQPGEIKGTATDVHFQGRMPLNSNAPSTLAVVGTVDLTLAQMFDPDVTSGGQLQFDIHAAGQPAKEDVEGQIRIVNAKFSTADTPVGLSNGNGVLTLHRDRIDISQFTGQVGGGTVTASGGVTYRPAVQFYVGLKGNDMRLLYPPTVRTGLGLNLVMTGNLDAAMLQGQVNVNSVSFTPDFDLSKFIAQFSGVSTPPPTQGFADNLKLNIAVHSASELRATTQQVSIEGNANLRVIGTANNPVIVGRANLTGGDLIFLGNRYLVQGGTIAFVNAVETTPVVNLQVNTTVQQYNVAMRFQGPLDKLHTEYTSDPSLPPADIIHLLAFGTTEEAANASPSQSNALGAEGVVASQVSSQITDRVQKAVGISQLSVDPQLQQTGNQPPGAVVTIQQRVTSNLFVTFSTDVTATANTQVQVQYHLSPKWSVSGVRDQNGGFGIDGRFHKDF
ncbi:MAG: translocation/assembly module TamB domain-containing protein [Candidatus Korobacteraceae bacterium]